MAKRKLKITGPSPSPEAFRIGDLLHSSAIHLLRRVRLRDAETGIGPAQLSALSVLVFGGPRSLGELAEAEQVRPPTMSRIISSLEKSALVRRRNTSDKRRVQLEATAKGTQILQKGRKRRVESLARALQTLTEAEREQAARSAELLAELVSRL